MALVLNATKEFRSEIMTPDSGGTNGRQISELDSLKNTEQGLYKCSFCPSVFPSLYHVQCHNIYKHSSLLKNHKTMEHGLDPVSMDLKTSSMFPSDFRNESIHNDKIKVSQSGALDLSTVRSRESHDPKPNCDKVSSSNNDLDDDSDNEECDKLVIDTQVETLEQEESSSQVTHHIPGENDFKSNLLYVKSDDAHNDVIRQSENCQSRPNEKVNEEHKNFENNNPSMNDQAIDFRAKVPTFQPTYPSETSRYNEIGSYSPSMYSQHHERKFSAIENAAVNQPLLGMIPPLPNIGMLGNFPMPFGFSPFMMMPSNSFMPPASMGNISESRFPLPSDGFPSSPAFNPNLNLQKSKAGQTRRSNVTKSSRSSQKLDKEKSVVEIYECKTCNRRFSQVGNFHNHMKTHDSKICACGICMMECGDSYELQRHMRNTHTGSMPYKCEQCDREFSQYNNLRRHLRVHNGKNYKCHLCGRSFNEVFYLEMHMGSHTGERTYKCGVCNAVFSDNTELQKHVSTHSAEELHTCEVCGKSFSKACVLRQHKKMHSGVRPFKCEICDKSFIHRHHLTIHSRMHSTNKPYTCNICKKEFAQTSHLYKHIQKHTEQPGITEEMIHQSLAPILERLKTAKASDKLLMADSAEKNLSDALNNNMNSNVKEGDTPLQSSHIERDTTLQSSQAERDITLQSSEKERNLTLQSSQQERDLTLYSSEKERDFTLQSSQNERDLTLQSKYSNGITVENEMKLVKVSDVSGEDIDKENNDGEKREISVQENQMKDDMYKQENEIKDDAGKTDMYNHYTEKMANVSMAYSLDTDYMNNSHNQSKQDSERDDHSPEEFQEKMLELDDNASDKTSISSTLSEARYLNSPHSGIPYDEQCLHESRFPSIPNFQLNPDTNLVPVVLNKDEVELKSLNCDRSEILPRVESIERYSPISQSGESVSEGDFRSRSNSACENVEPQSYCSNDVVSPRMVASNSILKEQPIPKDNCRTKTEIIMPPKKRRRYTSRQKKKSQESAEHEEATPKYPQMIQPMAAEAQQIYFLQLQQMQMALAANVMAAHGMMMQNPSSMAKSFNPENQRGVSNGYSNMDSSNPIDLNLMRQPLTGNVPFNFPNVRDNHDVTVSPSMQNGS